MHVFKGSSGEGRKSAHVRGRSRWFSVLTAFALVATLGLAGCTEPPDPIAVAGVWNLSTSGDGWTFFERWTITDSSVHYQSSSDGEMFTTTYRADIVEYVNGRLNAGDTALTAGRAVTTNPGFAIIRFTEVNNAGTGEVGKFNVFRWADNNADSVLRDFTQGSKDSDLDGDGNPNTGEYVNLVFDTASGAEMGAINDAGYFGASSDGASRQ
jgi:hypothetical protein